MTPDEFIAFVEDLRALGAVEVSAGEFRARFAEAPVAQEWDPSLLDSFLEGEDNEDAAKAAHEAWLKLQYGASG